MSFSLLLPAAYLIGAFPTSYLCGRLHGADLRKKGSGNLGATNVYRLFGLRSAMLVVTLDVAKGFFPVWFFPLWDGRTEGEWGLLYGFLAISGHIWPIFTRFRGGKGVATAAGVLLALAPLAVLVGSLVWLGLALITRFASLASLAAAALVPLVAWVAAAPPSTVLFALLLAFLVWMTHRPNIQRLLRHEELRLGAPAPPLRGGRATERGEEG
ncbi:MAG: glycerol-3-phosphate 1-O-acyltransferase PlsY [Gemmatimonadota bacterium]